MMELSDTFGTSMSTGSVAGMISQMARLKHYKDADLKHPQGTIELVAKAQKQIMRDGSPIKNVVLDLSNNGDGDADAAAYVIAWYAAQGSCACAIPLPGRRA